MSTTSNDDDIDNHQDENDKRVMIPDVKWEKLRPILLKRSSPISRFRSTIYWQTNNLEIFFNKGTTGTTTTTTIKNYVISIRSIGNLQQLDGDRDGDGTKALVDALKNLNILPKLLQKQVLDVAWPNHWLVHISPEDSQKLPCYSNENKGIFWNLKNDLFLFIWNFIPFNKQEDALLQGRFLQLEAHFLVMGLDKFPMQLEEEFKKGVTLEPPEANSEPLKIIKVEEKVEKFGEKEVKIGRFILTINEMPKCNEPHFLNLIEQQTQQQQQQQQQQQREGKGLMKKKKKTKKYMTGWWKDLEIRLNILPPCFTCGADGHLDQNCPYSFTLINLLNNIQNKNKNNQNHGNNHHDDDNSEDDNDNYRFNHFISKKPVKISASTTAPASPPP